MTTYTRFDGASTDRLFGELVDLYAVVYAEPPYEEGPEQVESFRVRLREDIARPGFTLVAAQAGEQLVGAAFGWPMPAGTWWSKSEEQEAIEVRNSDKFAVLEWIVRPDRRGVGIGEELIRRLLANRPEPLATLASDPRSAARKMYERAGWRPVAGMTLPWGPAMDLLVINLPPIDPDTNS